MRAFEAVLVYSSATRGLDDTARRMVSFTAGIGGVHC